MIPLSVLGRLRHALVAALDTLAAQEPARPCAAERMLPVLRESLQQSAAESNATVSGCARARRRGCDRSEIARAVSVARSAWTRCWLRASVACWSTSRTFGNTARRSSGPTAAGAAILLATPRIQKPRERGIFRALLRHGADGILARNLAGLDFFPVRACPWLRTFRST